MIKGIYQRCYTNTESSGWVPVAVSPDIPKAAADYCAKNIQGKNSQINNNSVDENNNVLNLFEFDSDNDYLYLTHTQYGLTSRDRPNMFSHSYIFHWNEKRLNDPGLVLTLADSNFCDNEADAMAEITNPEYLAPFSLQEIISKYNISKDNLRIFIGAIINQFSKKKSERMPLFLQYDGSALQIKELLYLILKLIPRFIRRQISAASCESSYTREKPLIFSIRATTKYSYVDLFTGRNNVLDETGLRKLKRLGYPLYAVNNLETVDIDKYFSDLEDITVKLTGNASANRLALQICHSICTGNTIENMDDNSSIDTFFNVLDLDSQTDFYYEYLAKCFKRAVDCQLTLTEVAEKALLEKIKSCGEDKFDLNRTYLDYEVKKVSAMNDDDASRYLSTIDSSLALSICRSLLADDADERRKKIIENYYIQHRLRVNTFDALYDVVIEMLSIENLVKNNENLKFFFRNKLSEFFDKYIYNADIAFFEKYRDLVEKLYPDPEARILLFDKKKDFWERLSFDKIKFEKYDFYQYMANDIYIDNVTLLLKYISLPDYYYGYGVADYIFQANDFYNDPTYKLQYEQRQEESINALVKYFASRNRNDGNKERCYTRMATVGASFRTALEAAANMLSKVENKADYQTVRDEFIHTVAVIKNSGISGNGAFVSADLSSGVSLLRNNLCSAIISELHNQDAESVVPLDLWLEVGNALLSSKYNNPFKLLEEEKPRILDEEPLTVYANSQCLKELYYINCALEYASGSASDERVAGVVRKWVKIAQNGGREEEPQSRTFETGVRPAFVDTAAISSINDPDIISENKEESSDSNVSDNAEDEKNKKKGLGGFFDRFKKG